MAAPAQADNLRDALAAAYTTNPTLESARATQRAALGLSADQLEQLSAASARGQSAVPIEERLAMKERFPDPEHPVVRTHPVTGKKSLMLGAFATHRLARALPATRRIGAGWESWQRKD